MDADLVIKKWSTFSSNVTDQKAKDELLNNHNYMVIGQDVGMFQARRSKKMKKKLKRDENSFAVAEVFQSQRRFKLSVSILQDLDQTYQTYHCKKCQSVLEFIMEDKHKLIRSQTLSFTDLMVTTKRYSFATWLVLKKNNNLSIKEDRKKPNDSNLSFLPRLCTWKLFQVAGKLFFALCFQTKDQMALSELRKKDFPIIFTHNSKDSLHLLLLHIYLLFSDYKVPLTVIEDSLVSSSILRYIMKKIGFVFLEAEDGNDNVDAVGEEILDYLEANQSVLIPSRDYQFQSSQSQKNVFDKIIQAQRDNDKRLSRTLLMPVTASTEMESNKNRKLSLRDLFFWSFSPQHYGLFHVNFSRPLKLKSLVKVAAELNSQETVNEENNIITRHLQFDFHNGGVILPIHILSFLLLTKYRRKKLLEMSEILSDTQELIEQIKEKKIFLGFTGCPEDVVCYALDLLTSQRLVETDKKNRVVTCCFGEGEKEIQLLTHAYKILHHFIPSMILASAIVASVGGEELLYQGNGCSLNFQGSKVLDKANQLAEMISFLVDFHCSFNDMTDTLVSALEEYVSHDVVKVEENNFEDRAHQRLVNSYGMNHDLCGEDDAEQQDSETIYQVVQSDCCLEELQSKSNCLKPFICLCYTLLAIAKEQLLNSPFSVDELFEKLNKRYKDGFFNYGEVVTRVFVSRCCDYFFEHEYIDDEDENYCLPQHNTDQINELLYQLLQFI